MPSSGRKIYYTFPFFGKKHPVWLTAYVAEESTGAAELASAIQAIAANTSKVSSRATY